MAQAYNLSYLGDRDRRILVQDHPRQKVSETLSKNKLGMMVLPCNPSYTGGRGRWIKVQGWHGAKVQDPI
jgi:hypothetical protein